MSLVCVLCLETKKVSKINTQIKQIPVCKKCLIKIELFSNINPELAEKLIISKTKNDEANVKYIGWEKTIRATIVT